ncbi:MAG TPA: PRC-barrel domain-containing protein [Fibrobacteria bacterium]|nr:PRC-barrel domain-containing protein [Fibrobacteria bacterium]
MLHSARKTKAYSLATKDGRIGHVREYYFDDHAWAVRYLVAQAGNWLTGRLVLISPHSLGQPDRSQKLIPVDLTRDQIRQGPSPESDRPVSRQFEMDYYQYFGWPYYWVGPYLWGPSPYPVLPAPTGGELDARQPQDLPKGDPHLRSTDEVSGYHIQARDGELGHVEDFLFDDRDWAIRFVDINTRNLWGGRRILVPPAWIRGIRWEDRKMQVDATQEDLRNAPPFDPHRDVDGEYASQLTRYYEAFDYERSHG